MNNRLVLGFNPAENVHGQWYLSSWGKDMHNHILSILYSFMFRSDCAAWICAYSRHMWASVWVGTDTQMSIEHLISRASENCFHSVNTEEITMATRAVILIETIKLISAVWTVCGICLNYWWNTGLHTRVLNTGWPIKHPSIRTSVNWYLLLTLAVNVFLTPAAYKCREPIWSWSTNVFWGGIRTLELWRFHTSLTIKYLTSCTYKSCYLITIWTIEIFMTSRNLVIMIPIGQRHAITWVVWTFVSAWIDTFFSIKDIRISTYICELIALGAIVIWSTARI